MKDGLVVHATFFLVLYLVFSLERILTIFSFSSHFWAKQQDFRKNVFFSLVVYPPYTLSGPNTKKHFFMCVFPKGGYEILE